MQENANDDRERITRWLKDGGEDALKEAMAQVHKDTAYLRFGTPEFYQEQVAAQVAAKNWDEGPFL